MEKTNTVIINGRHYDRQTGLPLNGQAAQAARKAQRTTPAQSVHSSAPQRSETLNRRVVKKHAPVPKAPLKPARTTIASAVHAPAQPGRTGRTMDIARSSRISRFAPKPVAKPQPAATKDHPPVSHPIAARAIKRQAAPKPVATKPVTSAEVKQQAIAKALSKPSPSREPHKKKSFWSRHRRLWIVLGIVIIILGVGGYTAFVNLPGLSVSFAAQQAGIKASYPSYAPDGYSLQQPVTFSDGQVTLTFVSNGGSKAYTITETRSSWDSSAVLENVVQKSAGSNYITTQDSGLTIYNYTGNAAWVNNGILYTITTKAPLSNEQIRNIATSL